MKKLLLIILILCFSTTVYATTTFVGPNLPGGGGSSSGVPNQSAPANQVFNSITGGTFGSIQLGCGNLSDSQAGCNLKLNLTATTNPGVSNDNTQGYAIGSLWFNKSTGGLFQASDVTTGAAIWKYQVYSVVVGSSQLTVNCSNGVCTVDVGSILDGALSSNVTKCGTNVAGNGCVSAGTITDAMLASVFLKTSGTQVMTSGTLDLSGISWFKLPIINGVIGTCATAITYFNSVDGLVHYCNGTTDTAINDIKNATTVTSVTPGSDYAATITGGTTDNKILWSNVTVGHIVAGGVVAGSVGTGGIDAIAEIATGIIQGSSPSKLLSTDGGALTSGHLIKADSSGRATDGGAPPVYHVTEFFSCGDTATALNRVPLIGWTSNTCSTSSGISNANRMYFSQVNSTTITEVFCTVSTAPSGGTMSVTVDDNDVATAVTVSGCSGATCGDSAHTVTIASTHYGSIVIATTASMNLGNIRCYMTYYQ